MCIKVDYLLYKIMILRCLNVRLKITTKQRDCRRAFNYKLVPLSHTDDDGSRTLRGLTEYTLLCHSEHETP
jgi:hypothetical protein